MLELIVSMHLIREKNGDLDHHKYLSPFLYALFSIRVITLKTLLLPTPRRFLSGGEHKGEGGRDPSPHLPPKELSAAHIGLIGSIGETCV